MSVALNAKCTAIKTNGEGCMATPLPGMETCWHHSTQGDRKTSGKTERAKTGVTRTAIEATRVLMLYGNPKEGLSGEEALADELARTAGHVEWLQEQLATADPTQFVKSMWLFKRQSGYIREDELDTASWNASAAIWLDLYLKERQHLVRVAETALRANVDERRVRIAENLADQLGASITWMLEQLGLDTQDPEVRHIAYQALQRASGQVIAGELTQA